MSKQVVLCATSQDSRTAGQQDSRTAGQQDSRTAGQQDSRTAGQQDSRTAGAAVRVLVVDDEPMIRMVVQRMLNDCCIVDCAGTALEAVEKAKDGDYDFALMDLHMPEYDGLWLMQNWKLPRKTKVILMTGHVTKEIVRQMFKLGISSYMMKPVTRDEILHQFRCLSKPRHPAETSPTTS